MFPTKKKINLRGANAKNKVETRDDFIKNNEEERKNRILENKKVFAISQIKCLFFRKKDLQKEYNFQREQFDKEIKDLTQKKTENESQEILNLMTKLNFFFSSDLDINRLLTLSQVILKNYSLHGKESNLSNFFYLPPSNITENRSSYLTAWSFIVKRFVEKIICVIPGKIEFLQILNRLLNVDSILIQDINQKKQVFLNIIHFSIERGLYSSLYQLISKFSPLEKKNAQLAPVITVLFTLVFRPLLYKTNNEKTNQTFLLKEQFIKYILTLDNPLLIQSLPSPLLHAFGPSLNLVLSFGNPKEENTSSSWYTSGIFKETKVEKDNLTLNEKTKIIKNIFPFLPGLLEKNQSNIYPIISFLNEISRSVLSSPEPEIIESISSSVSNPEVIDSIFSSYLLKQTNTDEIFIILCQLYNSILDSLPWKSSLPILNKVCFSTDSIFQLWNQLEKTKNFSIFKQNILLSSWSLDQTDTTIESLLSLFAKLFYHLLLSLEDDEFYKEQKPFKHSDLGMIIGILKDVALRGYLTSVKSSSANSLLGSVTRLLKQLYLRNCKNVFCPSKTWLMNDLLYENLSPDRLRIILDNIPFTIDFTKRVQIFYDALKIDKQIYQPNIFDHIKVRIRRTHILEDGLKELGNLTASELKKTIRVEFLSQDLVIESGIDGGGLFKEFFEQLIKVGYNPEYGLFIPTPNFNLYPNPYAADILPNAKNQFYFLGKILGKAIYEGILVELPFSNFFLTRLLGGHNTVNDLVYYDNNLYRQLMKLKNLLSDEIEDLDLTFSVVDNVFGKNRTIDLIPNGSKIDVTKENLYKYIAYAAHFRLNLQIKAASEAFQEGLLSMIPSQLLKMFNTFELRTIINGHEGGIDIQDLKQNTVYGNGYYADHPLIKQFWQVLEELDYNDQRRFLCFTTSASRAPLLGFSQLEPKFCIHQSRKNEPNPQDFLPTASTCMNLLKLPYYNSIKILKEKLVYAINSNSGFELS